MVSIGPRKWQQIEDEVHTPLIRYIHALVWYLVIEPPKLTCTHGELLIACSHMRSGCTVDDQMVPVPLSVISATVNVAIHH